MKRLLAGIFGVCLFFCAGLLPVYAAEYDADVLQELYVDSGLPKAAEQLDEQTLQLLEGMGISADDAAGLVDADLSSLPKEIWNIAQKQLKKPFAQFATLTGILLFCLVLQGVGSKSFSGVSVNIFVTLGTAGVLGNTFITLFRQLSAVFETVGAFMESFMPAYAGIVAASGQGAAAFGMQSLTFGASAVIVQLMKEIFLPVLCVYLVMCLVCSAGELIQMNVITGAISQAAAWVLGIVMALFTMILGLQRMIAQAADSLGLRTAKLALSTFIPVVGSSLSDALSSVTTCLQLLKTSAGGFGILALVFLFLPVTFTLLGMLLVLKLSQLVSGLLGVEAAGKIFGSLSGGIGLLLGIVLCAETALIIALTLLASIAQV